MKTAKIEKFFALILSFCFTLSLNFGITSAEESKPEKPIFRFLVLADTHISTPDELENFRKFLYTVRNEDFDFFTILGDICGQAPEYLPRLREVVAHSGLKFYPVSGNHDDDYGRRPEWYQSVFDRMFYTFDHKGVRFIMDWSQRPQSAWLKKQLDALPKEMPAVLCRHYPPPLMPGKEVKAPWPTITKEKKIDLILCGHWHRRIEQEYQGIKTIVFDQSYFNLNRENPGEYAFISVYPNGIFKPEFFNIKDLKLEEPPNKLPEIRLVETTISDGGNDPIVLTGTASDDEGISWIEYSLNYGPWVKTIGKEEWKVVINRNSLLTGHHFIQVRPVDSTCQPGIQIKEKMFFLSELRDKNSVVLQEGTNDYTGCIDITVRKQGNKKRENGSEGNVEDLECWIFKSKRWKGELSEIYIRFVLTKTGLKEDSKIKSAKLILHCNRQNMVRGDTCWYMVTTAKSPWTADVTFETRPKVPGWDGPTEPNPKPEITACWPVPGSRQNFTVPVKTEVDLSIFISDIKKWLKDPTTNHGWVISPKAFKNYNMSFHSTKSNLTTARPKLVIELEKEEEK